METSRSHGCFFVTCLLFDIRNSLLLESPFKGLANRAYVVGYGPNQGQLCKIRSDKNVLAAEKMGQSILDFGVSQNLQDAKQSLFTSQNEGCNPEIEPKITMKRKCLTKGWQHPQLSPQL